VTRDVQVHDDVRVRLVCGDGRAEFNGIRAGRGEVVDFEVQVKHLLLCAYRGWPHRRQVGIRGLEPEIGNAVSPRIIVPFPGRAFSRPDDATQLFLADGGIAG
jgi:hypothetical protein